jgi:DNA-binding GntR family transcriptional regulator
MSQVELAHMLAVSRTPLRGALRLLQHEGLIVSEANRRVQISGFSIDDIEQLYVMRVSLEVVAIRITVPVLRPEDHGELEGLMAQMDHFGDRGDFERLEVPHRAFHARLVSTAGARPMRLMEQLFDHAERYRRAYGALVPGAWPARHAEHRELLDAVEDRDTDGAARLLAAHYARTALRVMRAFDEERRPARLEVALAAAGITDLPRVD